VTMAAPALRFGCLKQRRKNQSRRPSEWRERLTFTRSAFVSPTRTWPSPRRAACEEEITGHHATVTDDVHVRLRSNIILFPKPLLLTATEPPLHTYASFETPRRTKCPSFAFGT
jgi:hypothetical protein